MQTNLEIACLNYQPIGTLELVKALGTFTFLKGISMLKTQSLFFKYDQQTEFKFPNIQLDEGENLLILGESGIGKTTLLHLIGGLLKPVSGSISLKGTDISKLSANELDRFRGKHIGLVFQQPHFVRVLTLQENLELVQNLAGKGRNTKRIGEVAASLGISDKLSKKPYTLSQGEQQRAAIALAVVNCPQLILADEPTASLDDKNCSKVAELLKEQAESSKSLLVIITHDQRLKAEFQNTLTL